MNKKTKQIEKYESNPVNSRMNQSDVEQILYELDAWEHGERGDKLTWQQLERFSGYTRQALWAREIIKDRYRHVKMALKNGQKKPNSNQYRLTLEARIKSLEGKLDELKIQQNIWLELWARYEYNAQVMGINTQELEKPLPAVNR